jgi:polygalacturonase
MRALAVPVLFCAALFAQDTRNVSEPVIPPVCATLTARLAITAGEHPSVADESKEDTAAIQHALDRCAAGHAVELKADGSRRAFLSGPLELRDGVTLLVDSGVVLFASRNARDYDRTPGSCGVVNDRGHGCRPLLGGDGVQGAAIMGDGAIDGRGWATILGLKKSWWDLAQDAKRTNQSQQCPRLVVMMHARNFTLYRITLRNSPNFHVFFNGDGFTAWGVKIDSPKLARNTDGIDPSSATNVTITHCFIHAGDDDVAIKAGKNGPSEHITVAHNHFYTGHGVSIGSETNGGVSAVRVSDLSIDGADNGIRIKSNVSRGGLVHDIVYSNVCIRDTKNPILMDSTYPFYGAARDEFPDFRDIVLRDVRVLSPGRISLNGYDAAHRLRIDFDNVHLDDPAATRIRASHAVITLGPGPVNFRPSGEDVRLVGKPGAGSPNACPDMFVPMPGAAQ